MSITVTKMHIASTSGGNKMPRSGDVWFSDGATYGWFRHAITNEIFFSNWRQRRGGQMECYRFASPLRAAALDAALNT